MLKSATVHKRFEIARQVIERKPASVGSTTDLDARFGWKGRVGYQQQMAMTKDTEIIVGVRVTPGDRGDTTELLPLVDDLTARHPGMVEELVADKGYDRGRTELTLRNEAFSTT